MSRVEDIDRRPGPVVILVVAALVMGGFLLTRVRSAPPEPPPETGRSLESGTGFVSVDLIWDAARPRNPPAAPVRTHSRLMVAGGGRVELLDVDPLAVYLGPGTPDDLPLTRPLVAVRGGAVGVSGETAVFLADDSRVAPVDLAPATSVAVGPEGGVWVYHRNRREGPYIDLVSTLDGSPLRDRRPVPPGILPLGGSTEGLFFGLFGRIRFEDLGGRGVDLLGARTVLASDGRFVVVTIGDCASAGPDGCGLRFGPVDDLSELDLGPGRLPSIPVAALSPDRDRLALWVVYADRLSMVVVDLANGDAAVARTFSTELRPRPVAWAPDGSTVFFVDPDDPGLVWSFQPGEELAEGGPVRRLATRFPRIESMVVGADGRA